MSDVRAGTDPGPHTSHITASGLRIGSTPEET
jgi:hypothetical protein